MFPVSALPGANPIRCPHDGSPLAVDVAGRRWRIEAVLGPRVGGGIFIAHHLITGVRAAVSLLYDARSGEMEERLNREVQAQRLLEPHPNLFKLLELGSERDGTRFYVSELSAEQTLRETLKEWRRPTDAGELFSQVGAVLRPLLGLLSTSYRLGIAHGELDTSQIFVAIADTKDHSEAQLVRPRLYGLRRFGPGDALVEAGRSDSAAVGQILFELLFGEPARLPFSGIQRAAVKARFGDTVGNFIIRALGPTFADGEGSIPSIDEMQRSLNTLRREVSAINVPTDPAGVPIPVDPLFERTDPNAAPSRMSDRRSHGSATPGAATPLPDLPPFPGRGSEPLRSGFSSELHQVSFADLLVLPQAPSSTGVVARGKYQTSLPDQAPPLQKPRPPRPEPVEAAGDELEIEVVTESAPAPAPPSFQNEATRDLHTQARPSGVEMDAPTQPPAVPERAQPAKFKLWGWWRR